jgi:O-methyltransferase involved in polyketide biosynthesis
MDSVNKTLYIPLYGKSYVSGKGLFISDKKAEEIWQQEGFALKGKSKSKWLAYYMGIRCAVFDDWVKQQAKNSSDAVIIHLGCGMDSRALRVGTDSHKWYDVDFADVINERKRYYTETDNYKMIAGDVRESSWLCSIDSSTSAIVVMEGISMYLTNEELKQLTSALSNRFEKLCVLMDCYTTFAAKMSKYKNPVNDVGVTQLYGIDNPCILENDKFCFVKEHDMTPQK